MVKVSAMGCQLSNGLYASGNPEPPKEKWIMGLTPIPCTGGDIHKSSELGKMFNISIEGSKPRKSGAVANFPSHSGPMNPNKAARSSCSTSSGPLGKHEEPIGKYSDLRLCRTAPVLPVTGLVKSGPLKSSGMPREALGPLAWSHSTRAQGSPVGTLQGVTRVGLVDEYSFKRNIPRFLVWGLIMLSSMGFVVGGFILGSTKSAVVLIVAPVLLFTLFVLCLWNVLWPRSKLNE